jgi:hypothetical protein
VSLIATAGSSAASARGVAVGGGSPERDERAADAQLVAVAKPAPAAHPLAVAERPVGRQPVVGDRPVVADALELRVRARDLKVPRHAQVGAGAAADRDLVVRQREDPLVVVVVAVVQQREAGALGVEPLLQFGGGRRVAVERPNHRPTVPAKRYR